MSAPKSRVPAKIRSSFRQKRLQRLRLLKRRMTELMNYRGWKRGKLAEEIGYSYSSVANVVLGYMKPQPEFITRIDLAYDQMVMERIARKTFLSRRALPKRVVLNDDWRCCRVCHWWFPLKIKRQKYCGPECAAAARR